MLIVGCKNSSIPNTVTSIGNSAFRNCTGLTSIAISSSVKTICSFAFYGCSSLTSFTIPASANKIESGVLGNCTSLKILNANCSVVPYLFSSGYSNDNGYLPKLAEITFGPNVKEIQGNWSSIVSTETKVSFNSIKQVCEMKYIPKTNMWNSSNCNPLSYSGKLFLNGIEMTNVSIPSDVDSICDFAFRGCSGITSLTISNSVKSIGKSSFEGCSGLISMSLGNGVTSLGNKAFYGCSGITSSLSLPNSVTTIGEYAFAGCRSLPSLTIGDGLTSISDYAFSMCSDMSSLTIGNNVTSIGRGAFYQCSGITSVIIPNCVATISDLAFDECSNITSLIIGEGVTSIGMGAFYGCIKLPSVSIPDNVKSIGRSAFQYCPLLTSVSLPNTLEFVGGDAFKGTPWYDDFYSSQPDGLIYLGKVCYKYKGTMPEDANIVVDEGTLYLTDNLFSDSCKLVSITFPEGLKGIGDHAFSGCSGLTSMDIPSSVISIGQYAFSDCNGLTSIDIPEGVSSIGQFAFDGCSSLSSITFPGSLKKIVGYIFGYNYDGASTTSLKSVTVGEGVEEIGYDVFKKLENATITLPNSVTTIGSFEGCKNCTVIIGTGIQQLNEAFSNTNGMTIYIHAFKRPQTNYHCFYWATNCKSYVPYGRGDAYESGRSLNGAYYWCGNITEMPYPALTIGSSGYATYCSNKALDFSEVEDVRAYVATDFIASSNTLILTRVMKTPAGEGIIVVGNPGTYDIPECTTDITYTNLLNGMSYPDYVEPTDGDYTNLLFTDCNAEMSFQPMEDATPFFAGTAYLHLPSDCLPTDVLIVEMQDEEDFVAPKYAVACRGGFGALPISMNNTAQVVGFQFDLQLPEGVTIATNSNGKFAATFTDRASDHSLSIRKVGDNLYRFVSVSMNNSTFSGTEGTLLNVMLEIEESVAIGDYEIIVKNMELTVADQSMIHSLNNSATLTVKNADPGDANGDMTVSVTDVGCAINYILEQVPSVFIFDAADMNGDKNVSVTDVSMIINLILNEGAATSRLLQRQIVENAHLNLEPTNDGYLLRLDNMDSFIGFQMDLQLADGATINDMQLRGGDDHLLTYRKLGNGAWRVICYSPTNSTFVANDADLLDISMIGNVTISDIRLTTNGFDELRPADLVGTATGIANVEQNMSISVQGRTLSITSERETTLPLYSIDGRIYRNLHLRRGQNTFDGLSAGIYMINNRKVILR